MGRSAWFFETYLFRLVPGCPDGGKGQIFLGVDGEGEGQIFCRGRWGGRVQGGGPAPPLKLGRETVVD